MRNLKGSLILLLAAFLWGTTFVAQTTGADSVGPFTFNTSRCLVACVFLGAFIFVREKIVQRRTKEEGNTEESERSASEKTAAGESPSGPGGSLIRGGVCCGVVLFLAMSCQQAGIGMYPENVAASGRSGFLTAIYVVLVAIVAQFKGRKLRIPVVLSVVGIMCGMYFLCLSSGWAGFYMGDVFELLCAVFFTFQIMAVDHFSELDSVKLSCMQFLTTGILSFVFCLVSESVSWNAIIQAAVPILYAGILSSGIAYTLQIVGQKYAEPAVASIVMSLESAFAAVSGCLVLGEVLSVRETLGCVLIFSSVILAQIPQFKREA